MKAQWGASPAPSCVGGMGELRSAKIDANCESINRTLAVQSYEEGAVFASNDRNRPDCFRKLEELK